ncbi:transcriptional adapter 1-like [Saccostrea echinata]|uniref:transcriptional adapter 1-like n=1 Tax=Saccostrea echinata TaxID=191078 RepID=UPI002A83AFEF|nr:transcriptional adapter 1-like [Saccostrea echinata]
MAASIDLNVAKKNLQESLGDEMKLYLQNMKSWFKQKITKEEFDLEARKLLPEHAVNLHNEFLLAIISRCQTLSSSLVPRENSIAGKVSEISKNPKPGDLAKHVKSKLNKLRRRSVVSKSAQRFLVANPLSKFPLASLKGAEDAVFASREMVLPDITMVHGRMLVCAWEVGLEEVTDTTVKYVMQTVENVLKNVISLMLSQRNGYKLREKKMRFSMGSSTQNPYQRQSYLRHDSRTESEATTISNSGSHVPCLKHTTELGEEEGVYELAMSEPVPPNPPVSMFDLLHALQSHPSIIPSHAVYEPAVQRAIHHLFHPSHENIDQELIHQQEQVLTQNYTPTNR